MIKYMQTYKNFREAVEMCKYKMHVFAYVHRYTASFLVQSHQFTPSQLEHLRKLADTNSESHKGLFVEVMLNFQQLPAINVLTYELDPLWDTTLAFQKAKKKFEVLKSLEGE